MMIAFGFVRVLSIMSENSFAILRALIYDISFLD
jgi:hypothetical protein